MTNIIVMEDRQVINFEPHVEWLRPIRHFGISLDADEAQEFIGRGYRVFGDEFGPYLVIRLQAAQAWPFVIDRQKVKVEFEPREWHLTSSGETGIICWLRSIL